MNCWNEPHRFFHTTKHLNSILNLFQTQLCPQIPTDRHILTLTAYFHDIVYNPVSLTNEEDSIKVMRSLVINPHLLIFNDVEKNYFINQNHKV